MANYEYIVSSLVDYSFDSETKGLNSQLLSNDLKELLSPKDWSILKELWWFFDLRNILSLRSGRTPIFSSLSNLTAAEAKKINSFYSAAATSDDDDSASELPQIPEYATTILMAYKDSGYAQEFEVDIKESIEKNVWESYYNVALASKNSFIREWSRFDLDIRNISAAFTARAKGMDVEKVIIGQNPITELIVANLNVPDFGLKNEFSEIDELLSLLSDGDMLSKERKLDKLRWKKIDSLIEFDYFNLNFILGYMMQISMLERWEGLTSDHGKAVLDKIVSSLTSKDNILED